MVDMKALRTLERHDVALRTYIPDGVYLLLNSFYSGLGFDYNGPWYVANGLWTRPLEWQRTAPLIPECTIEIQSTGEAYTISAASIQVNIVCYCKAQALSHPSYQFVQNMQITKASHPSSTPDWNWVTFASYSEIDVGSTDHEGIFATGKYLLLNAYSGISSKKCAGIWYKHDTEGFTRESNLHADSVIQVCNGTYAGNLYRLRQTNGMLNAEIDVLYTAIRSPMILTDVLLGANEACRQPVLQTGCVYGPDMHYSGKTHPVGAVILQKDGVEQRLLVVTQDNGVDTHPLCQNGSWCSVDTELLVQNPLSPFHAYRWHCNSTIECVTNTVKPLWRMQVPRYEMQDSYDYVLSRHVDPSVLCSQLTRGNTWSFESVAIWSTSGYFSSLEQSIVMGVCIGDTLIIRVWHETTGPWSISFQQNDVVCQRPDFYQQVHAAGNIVIPVNVNTGTGTKHTIHFRNVQQFPAHECDWLHIRVDDAIRTGHLLVTGTSPSTGIQSGSVVVNGGVGIAGDVHCHSVFLQSDIRLKCAVQPIEKSAVQLIRKLKPKQYQQRNRSGHQIGFIAQDVYNLAPELVQRDCNGLMSVNYIGLVPYIVRAIQCIQKTIKKRKRLSHRSDFGHRNEG